MFDQIPIFGKPNSSRFNSNTRTVSYPFSLVFGLVELQGPKEVFEGFTVNNDGSDKVDLVCTKIVQQKLYA